MNPSSGRKKTFFKILFVNFWMYVFSCCCLFNLMNPFINDIWLGEGYLFSETIVLLIVEKIYFTGMRSAAQTFKKRQGPVLAEQIYADLRIADKSGSFAYSGKIFGSGRSHLGYYHQFRCDLRMDRASRAV